jgi:hypothetical protein
MSLGGQTVDFWHMSATLNGLLYNSTSFKALAVGEKAVDDLCGWAGDLQTLLVDAIVDTSNSNTYQTIYNKMYALMGSSSASFSSADLYADLDAIYFGNQLTANPSIDLGASVALYYRGAPHNMRFTYFIDGRTKDQFKADVYKYTKNAHWSGVQWPLFSGYSITTTQSEAARDAFVNYIWERRL